MTTTFIPILAPRLAELVNRLDDAVRAPRPGLDVPHAVGEALRPFLGLPGLLTPQQEAGDADRYRTHLLHVPDDGAYSLVAAVWRPGQRTAVHDHIAWCVVGVHRGEEHEIRYRLVDGHLVEDGHTVGPRGEVTVLTPPGDIHAVVNDGTAVAASLHVYGADLRQRGTGVRRCYSLPSPLSRSSVSPHSRSSCSFRAADVRRAHSSPPCLGAGASA